MIYLYLYVGIGVAVLAVVFVIHLLTEKNEWESRLNAMNLNRKKPPERTPDKPPVLTAVFAVAVFAVVAVAMWPLAAYLQGKDIFAEKIEKHREFAVRRAHLQERLTVRLVEVREVVVDPLGAVTDLPFGHLNAAWKTFIGSAGADDTIWSFTAPWQTTWGRKEVRTGYVFVRYGAPAGHFRTMCKEIEDEPKKRPRFGWGMFRTMLNKGVCE